MSETRKFKSKYIWFKMRTSSLKLIVKVAIPDGPILDIYMKFNVYHKEMEFYDKIVPKFNEKLKQLGESDLFAECFGVCRQRNVLIFEDLSAKGFKSRNPSHGLNADETKAVLKRLASFHAIGAVLQEEQSDIFTIFKNGKCFFPSFLFQSYFQMR